MKKFRFSLQNVLDFRISMEKEEQNKLGTLNYLLMQAEEDKKKKEELLVITMRACNEEQNKGLIDIKLIVEYERYIKTIRELIIVACELIEERKENVEKQKIVLTKASQEVKILEKLKEKELVVFIKEQNKQEGYLLDEIGIQKYIRKQGEDL